MNPMRFVLLPCLCLLACTPSVPEVIAKHRPAVEKTFASIQKLQPLVEGTAEVTELAVKAPEVPLRLEGPEGANATFVYVEDLAKPGGTQAVTLRTIDSHPLAECGALLERAQYLDPIPHPRPTAVQGYLAACARLRYVLVIRSREFVNPESAVGAKQFVPGRYRADVLAFDLTTGQLLGGFPVSAKNNDAVTVVSGEDQDQRLLRNLEATVFSALREGALKAFPGAIPPSR